MIRAFVVVPVGILAGTLLIDWLLRPFGGSVSDLLIPTWALFRVETATASWFVALTWWGIRRNEIDLGRSFVRIPPFAFVAKAILGATGLSLVIIPVETLSISVFGLPTVVPGLPPDMLMARFLRFYSAWDTLVIFSVVVVLWPAAEELFFRGLVQNTLTRNFAVWPSIVVTNVLFALAHFHLAYYLGSFVAGLGLSLIYQRTRSLVLVASIHSLLNLSALLGIYWLFG